MLKPPKGIRTYRLEPDPNITDDNEIPINGTIAVMLNLISTTQLKIPKKNVPKEVLEEIDEDESEEEILKRKYDFVTKYNWKLQIKKLTKVTALDSLKLSNPYCEIFYKGLVELPDPNRKFAIEEEDIEDEDENSDEENPKPKRKTRKKKVKKQSEEEYDKIIRYIPHYILIGSTKTNYQSIEFEYNDKENHDYSYYDLPPVYTRMVIPSSDHLNNGNEGGKASNSPQMMAKQRIGGYTSKHLLKEIKEFNKRLQEEEKEKKDGNAFDLIGGQETGMIETIKKQREYQKYQELLMVELKFQLEISKIIILNEETERLKMLSEEKELRSVINQNLFNFYQEDILLQDYFALQFQNLLENIVTPSPILSRLRFLMGEIDSNHDYYQSSLFTTPDYTPMTLQAAKDAGYSKIRALIGQREDEIGEEEEIVESRNPQTSHPISVSSLPKNQDDGMNGLTNSPQILEGSSLQEPSMLSLPMNSLSVNLGMNSQESLENAQMNEFINQVLPGNLNPLNNYKTEYDQISMKEYMFQRFRKEKLGPTASKHELEMSDKKMTTQHHSKDPETYHNQQDSSFLASLGLSKQIQKNKKDQKNSSMVIRCEDPATQNIVHVIIIPILNAADESYLQENILKLIGKYSYYLMKILDFGIYNLKIFNAQGFNTIHEKIGVIIKEYYHNTITLMDYVSSKWTLLTNDSLRELFLQCALAIKELHDEKILHQNLSPNCFMITFLNAVKGRNSQAKNDLKSSASNDSLAEKPLVKLDHYWLLESPRNPYKVKTLTDNGNDFGNFYTIPPEFLNVESSKNNELINEKIDIFSFGVCIYYFATKGQLLPFNPFTLLLPNNFSSTSRSSRSKSSNPSQQYYYYQQEMEKIYQKISSRWGTWITTLLRMCLCFEPSHRASLQEIILFLQKRIGK